ncbi:MAG: hypothetical protein IKJ04_01830, partial [Clostridia bacterium]|nr:hypothetical protein [Clostridia bacterium]
YTGEVITPEISELIEGVKVVTYKYTQNNEDTQPINVGDYVAHAELAPENENYVLVGTFNDLAFSIIPQEETVQKVIGRSAPRACPRGRDSRNRSRRGSF